MNTAAVSALVELQLVAALLGINFGLDAAGVANAASAINSENGEFPQSVSSTDVYCTNLTCYDKAVVYNDIQCNGNLHCGLGDVFCLQLDSDYAKNSTSLSVPRLTTNNAIVNTLLTAPFIDVSQTLNA